MEALNGLDMKLPDLDEFDHTEIPDDRLPSVYAKLYRMEKQLKAKRKAIKQVRDEMQDRIFEYFNEVGYQNVKTTDGTVYISSTLRASKDKETSWPQAAQAVKRVGWDDIVDEKFNHQSLSGLIRERVEQDYDGDWEAFMEDMPDEFSRSINIYEDFKAKVRSS